MANTINSIAYGGYVYKVGDTIQVKNNIMYTGIISTAGNTVNMLTQCVMQIAEIWEGSSAGITVKNPLRIKWVSGPSGSYNGGGFIRLDQIVEGSGGTATIVTGNVALYAYDTRTKRTLDTGGWAESFYIDWNSFGANNGNSISHYEIWYEEAPDAGNKPGAWSGRVRVKNVSTTAGSGYTIVGTVNQASQAGDWGARGYWYRFSVVAIGKNGGYSRTDLFTNHLRKCTVVNYSFNANGGSGAPGTQYKPVNYPYIFPGNKPTKTGHTFMYWLSPNGGHYSPGQTVNNLPNSNTTFTAVYTANPYTITYTANGGSGANQTQQCIYGQQFTAKGAVFSRTGYTMDYWNAPSGSWGLNASGVYGWTQSVTFSAHWKINSYTLTVNPNGGTWNGAASPQKFTQNYGSTKSIPNPTRTGYTFVRWKLSGTGSMNGTTFTYGAGNGTLTAEWQVITYTVTFNATANGGIVSEKSRKVNHGSKIGALPIPTKQYYKFTGWFTSASGGTKIDANQVITGNVTYYAQFVIDATLHEYRDGKFVPMLVFEYTGGQWEKVFAFERVGNTWKQGIGG